MNKGILGIDLGTSSVKLLLRFDNGEIRKAKCAYEKKHPKGGLMLFQRLLLNLKEWKLRQSDFPRRWDLI